jgi:hypothetical protein
MGSDYQRAERWSLVSRSDLKNVPSSGVLGQGFMDNASAGSDDWGVRAGRPWFMFVAVLMAWAYVAGGLFAEPVGAVSAPPVRVQVVLASHKAVAGVPISATVILTNRNANPITVHACPEDPWLEVGLNGDGYTYSTHRYVVAVCKTTIQLHHGPNEFQTTVYTTYQRCIEGGRPSASTPACEGSATVPPLPVGRYVTSLSIMGLSTHLTTATTPQVVSLVRG